MSQTTVIEQPQTKVLKLRSGGEYTVSTAAARDCTPEEIPIIDLQGVADSKEKRESIARQIKAAAETSGFFYIKNHGIPQDVIQKAHGQVSQFFALPLETKEQSARTKSSYLNNGWSGPRSTHVSPGESLDTKEGFGWSYCPSYDPLYEGHEISDDMMKKYSCDEPHVWDASSQLPEFKKATLAYWKECITLARKMLKLFALSIDLPEDYFDNMTKHPGADGVYNLYHASSSPQKDGVFNETEVGLGAHTDLQCFTLLWQDMNGGLQILNKKGEWIWATPVEGTIVVNIADFLSRLTNDRYRSTVHRAYNRGLSNRDRISMPFFFGFDYDAKCSVLPSCIDEDHPAKYAPTTAGEWRQMRFAQNIDEAKKAHDAKKVTTY